MDLLPGIREALIIYMIFMMSLCLKAWAQALVGDKLGDPLPRLQGRVTLNPLVHMDLMGSVIFPLICLLWPLFVGGMRLPLFAWSKPVQLAFINPKTRVRDEICLALTGVGGHLILCLLWVIIGGYISLQWPHLIGLVLIGLQINATLTFFHLLPIPPFDGGILLRHITRMKDETYETLTRYSLLIFLILISLPLFRSVMGYIISAIEIPFRYILIKILT
jgi:Zn-dependent protease